MEYTKTLLKRAKGSELSVFTIRDGPIEVVQLLSAHTQQIKSIRFGSSLWKDIQQFSEINHGPIPLLRDLEIHARRDFSLDHLDGVTRPSLPLFSKAVNLKNFILRSPGPPYLSHFTFPNLTSFELWTGSRGLHGYRTSELLNFLEASPMLRTVSLKITTETILLGDASRQGRVVVLPNVEVLSLAVEDSEAGFELITQISCPSVKRTLLKHERMSTFEIPLIIFPDSTPWSTISREYTRSLIEEVALEMKANEDPIISCSVAFRSLVTTVLGLEFKLLENDIVGGTDGELTFEDVYCPVFSQASRAVQEHPLLPNVKRLRIGYRDYIGHSSDLRRLGSVFRKLFCSVGQLDSLSIYGCDPCSFFFAPFDSLEPGNAEEPVVYPLIKELEISHPLIEDVEESMIGIVEFARLQCFRGLPLERVTLCMEKLPEGIEDRLRRWVPTVNCYEAALWDEDIFRGTRSSMH